MKRIILASTSPRRRALLEQIGLKFTVDACVREDTEFVGQEPHQLAREIALKKAKSVAIWDWISNPVDVSIIGDSGITDMEILQMMGKHPDFDLLMANLNEETMATLATPERLTRTLANLANNYIAVTKNYGKPFLAVIGEKGLGNENYNDLVYKLTRDVRSRLLTAGVPFYPSMERAASAAMKVMAYFKRKVGGETSG